MRDMCTVSFTISFDPPVVPRRSRGAVMHSGRSTARMVATLSLTAPFSLGRTALQFLGVEHYGVAVASISIHQSVRLTRDDRLNAATATAASDTDRCDQAHARDLPDSPPGEPPRPREAPRAEATAGLSDDARGRAHHRSHAHLTGQHCHAYSLDDEQVGSNLGQSRFSACFSCERVRQGCQDRGKIARTVRNQWSRRSVVGLNIIPECVRLVNRRHIHGALSAALCRHSVGRLPDQLH
jgi:hypothetical protein